MYSPYLITGYTSSLHIPQLNTWKPHPVLDIIRLVSNKAIYTCTQHCLDLLQLPLLSLTNICHVSFLYINNFNYSFWVWYP